MKTTLRHPAERDSLAVSWSGFVCEAVPARRDELKNAFRCENDVDGGPEGKRKCVCVRERERERE